MMVTRRVVHGVAVEFKVAIEAVILVINLEVFTQN
jgi:hypothetical protein